MADQNLLTVFIALTALAIIIQTGILVGLYVVSSKLTRQAEQALSSTRNLLGPLEAAAENLQSTSASIAEFGASAKGQLHQFQDWLHRRKT